MTLEFTDFAHHYRDSDWSDAQQREHFAVISDILECVVRFFWRGSTENPLGISFDCDSTGVAGEIESQGALRALFDDQVGGDAAESDRP